MNKKKEYKSVWEVCPHCEREVKLPAKKGWNLCPECGNLILACAMCDMDNVNCTRCPFDANLVEEA